MTSTVEVDQNKTAWLFLKEEEVEEEKEEEEEEEEELT